MERRLEQQWQKRNSIKQDETKYHVVLVMVLVVLLIDNDKAPKAPTSAEELCKLQQ